MYNDKRNHLLTGQQQNENEGKQVRIFCEHIAWNFHGHDRPEEAGDALFYQVIKGGAPGSSDTGRTWTSQDAFSNVSVSNVNLAQCSR